MADTNPLAEVTDELAYLIQGLQNIQNSELSLCQYLRIVITRHASIIRTLLECTPKALQNDVLMELIITSRERHEKHVGVTTRLLERCREDMGTISDRIRELENARVALC